VRVHPGRTVEARVEAYGVGEPGIQAIIVAVGGGGLYAGVAAATEGRVQIVAVEPLSCPTLQAALDAGHPVDVSVSGVAAASLGVRCVGEIVFGIASRVNPTSVPTRLSVPLGCSLARIPHPGRTRSRRRTCVA
jgi:threonine dehydratase